MDWNAVASLLLELIEYFAYFLYWFVMSYSLLALQQIQARGEHPRTCVCAA